MTALLWYGNQAFCVTNGTKDLLYEAALKVAKCDNPVAHQRLVDDGRLIGCYDVSGVGFELEAFEEAFGGKEAWKKATTLHFDAVEALCSTRQCVEHMTKLFHWIWFLLDGGKCNSDEGEYPVLENLPERPTPDGAGHA